MYFLIAYDKADLALGTGWQSICRGTYKSEKICKDSVSLYTPKENCYILNGETGEIFDARPVTWSTKARCQDKKQAMELISDRLKELLSAIGYGRGQLDEIESFASKHGVPFSAEMHALFLDKTPHPVDEDEDEVEEDDPWDNSGCSWDTSGC